MAFDVRLRLRGLMVEKFLQRAIEEGVELLDVRRSGLREASFSASEQGSRKLLALAEAYKLDVAVIERRGLTRLKDGMHQRPSLPISLLLCVILVALFLSRLWIIELPDGTDPAIASSLAQLGVEPGISLSTVDTRAIEQGLHMLTGQYAFVGARLDGVRLKITTVEELPEPDLYSIGSVRDLVAARDAVLVAVNAFSGESIAKPGDTVRRGQLLIKGEEKISDEVSHGVCALGEVIGRVWLSAEVQGNLTEQIQVPTGRVSLSSELRLLTYAIPLLEGSDFELEQTSIERLPVGGLFLPLMIVRTRNEETRPIAKSIEPEALKTQLGATAMQMALEKVPQNAEIVDKWIDYSMIEGERIRARAVVETRQNIAVSRTALVYTNPNP